MWNWPCPNVSNHDRSPCTMVFLAAVHVIIILSSAAYVEILVKKKTYKKGLVEVDGTSLSRPRRCREG